MSTEEQQGIDLRIAICTPTLGTMQSWTAQCITNLVTNFLESNCGEGVNSKTCRQFTVESSMLPEARTCLILEAIKYEATHILWVDGDMIFPWDSIQLLLYPGKPFIGVNYPRRKPPHIPTAYCTTNEDLKDCGEDGIVWTEADSTGLKQVTHFGLGLALVSMDVIYGIHEKFGANYPFFEMPSRGYRFGGEDVHFCHSAIEAGFKLYIDHDLSKHIGHLGQQVCNHELAIVCRDEGVVPLSKPQHWTVGPKYDRLKAAIV